MTFVDWIFAVLLIVTIIVMIVLTVYIVKFLKSATKTMTSIQELTDIAKEGAQPALKTVNNILETVNKVSNATNNNYEMVKKVITTLLGGVFLALGSAKGRSTGFLGGLLSGLSLFRKKGDKKCR